jgi:hypothetical protein
MRRCVAHRPPARGAAGNPAEGFGSQVAQIQRAVEHRSERVQHTRSEERRRLLRGPRLRGMARGRWVAWAPKHRLGFSASPQPRSRVISTWWVSSLSWHHAAMALMAGGPAGAAVTTGRVGAGAPAAAPPLENSVISEPDEAQAWEAGRKVRPDAKPLAMADRIAETRPLFAAEAEPANGHHGVGAVWNHGQAHL